MEDMTLDSQYNNGIKKDFVTCLPYDDIVAIFSFCSFQDCVRFTRVSTTWRSFLFCWPGLWENITEQSCNYTNLLKSVPPTIHGRHVHKVDVQDKSIEEQKAVLEFLQKMNCNALDSLRISASSNSIVRLKEVLQLSGSSLKYLDIVMEGDPRFIRLLAVIFTRCRSQLIHLRYRHDNPIRPLNLSLDGRLLPRQGLQNLISLDIGCQMEMSYFLRLMELLPRLKSICVKSDMIINKQYSSQLLEYLCIRSSLSSAPFFSSCQYVGIYNGFLNDINNMSNPWDDGIDNPVTNVASLFRRFIPTAILQNHDDDDIDDDSAFQIQSNINTTDTDSEQDQPVYSKLRRLAIQNLHDQNMGISLLRIHHSTLEAICVAHCRETTYLLFPPLEFPKLRDIRVGDNRIVLSGAGMARQNLVRMLYMSPCLKNVYLNCQMPLDHVIRSIQEGSQQLRTLCLKNSSRSADSGSLSRILSTGWPQLRCLSLYGVNDIQEAEHLTCLKNMIAACPCLEMVDLESALITGEGILSTIGNLEHLYYLRIKRTKSIPINRSMVSTESMITFLSGNCRHSLRKLCLLDITMFNDDILDAIVENLAANLVYLQLGYSISMFYTRQQRSRQRNNHSDPDRHGDGISISSTTTPDGIRRFGRGFVGGQLKYLGFSGLGFTSQMEDKQLYKACEDIQRLFPPEQGVSVNWNSRGRIIVSEAFGSIPLDPFSSNFHDI